MKQIAKAFSRHALATFGPHRWPSSRPRLWILMYHRVLPSDDPRAQIEEPGMIVTPDTLRRHIAWLQSEFEIMHLGKWIYRARNGESLPPKACAITFDDGWRDNFEFAFPILQQSRTPATIFVVSHLIDTNASFWPNRMARLLIEPRVYRDRVEPAKWLLELVPLGTERPPSRDEIAAVIRAFKSFTDDDVSQRLSRTEHALRLSPSGERALLSWDELRTMVDSGLVEVGSHSCHHRRLVATLPITEMSRQVVDSQTLLQERLGVPVRLFCYPNGDSTPEARRLVERHYSAAVTTGRGITTTATPLYQLTRIPLHEDAARKRQEFEACLSGWL